MQREVTVEVEVGIVAAALLRRYPIPFKSSLAHPPIMALHLVSHRAIHLDLLDQMDLVAVAHLEMDPTMGQIVMAHLHLQVEEAVETPFALSVAALITATLVLKPCVPLHQLIAPSAMGYILRLSVLKQNFGDFWQSFAGYSKAKSSVLAKRINS